MPFPRLYLRRLVLLNSCCCPCFVFIAAPPHLLPLRIKNRRRRRVCQTAATFPVYFQVRAACVSCVSFRTNSPPHWREKSNEADARIRLRHWPQSPIRSNCSAASKKPLVGYRRRSVEAPEHYKRPQRCSFHHQSLLAFALLSTPFALVLKLTRGFFLAGVLSKMRFAASLVVCLLFAVRIFRPCGVTR